MVKKPGGDQAGESCELHLPRNRDRQRYSEPKALHRDWLVHGQEKIVEIESVLAYSLRSHVRIMVVINGTGENQRISGFVTSIHTHSREIKLQWAEEWKWIGIDCIVAAYLA